CTRRARAGRWRNTSSATSAWAPGASAPPSASWPGSQKCARLTPRTAAASQRGLARLKEVAAHHTKNGRPLLDDPRFRDRLTRVEVELMALEITNLRFLDQLRGGRPPGAEVSLLKIKGTEIQQALTELMMQTAGPLAQAF